MIYAVNARCLLLSFLAEYLLPESNAKSLNWEALRQAFKRPT